MKTRKGKKYTKKEDDIIRDHYHIIGGAEVGKILNREPKSIRQRVYIIQAENWRKNWTPVEIDYIIQYYECATIEDFDLKDLVKCLGRDRATICKKANELGLTDNCRKNSDTHKNASGNGMKKWHSENEHPRGMLGKNHTEEVCKRMGKTRTGLKMNLSDEQRKAISERSRKRATEMMANGNAYSRTKSGIREDLGIYMRSNWEANFARIMNLEEKSWEYEKDIFKLKTENDGMKNYIMDFTTDEGFVEVKGWLDGKSKKTLRMFKACNPNDFEKTTLVIDKEGCKTHVWLMKLGIKKFIFYNELRAKYKDKIKWEGV